MNALEVIKWVNDLDQVWMSLPPERRKLIRPTEHADYLYNWDRFVLPLGSNEFIAIHELSREQIERERLHKLATRPHAPGFRDPVR